MRARVYLYAVHAPPSPLPRLPGAPPARRGLDPLREPPAAADGRRGDRRDDGAEPLARSRPRLPRGRPRPRRPPVGRGARRPHPVHRRRRQDAALRRAGRLSAGGAAVLRRGRGARHRAPQHGPLPGHGVCGLHAHGGRERRRPPLCRRLLLRLGGLRLRLPSGAHGLPDGLRLLPPLRLAAAAAGGAGRGPRRGRAPRPAGARRGGGALRRGARLQPAPRPPRAPRRHRPRGAAPLASARRLRGRGPPHCRPPRRLRTRRHRRVEPLGGRSAPHLRGGVSARERWRPLAGVRRRGIARPRGRPAPAAAEPRLPRRRPLDGAAAVLPLRPLRPRPLPLRSFLRSERPLAPPAGGGAAALRAARAAGPPARLRRRRGVPRQPLPGAGLPGLPLPAGAAGAPRRPPEPGVPGTATTKPRRTSWPPRTSSSGCRSS
jgi:hypothetical protein